MSKNSKVSSSKITSEAEKILKNPNASQIQKKLAGSALSQGHANKQTGSAMEDLAAKVLQSPKYNSDTKSLAGSVLSQANKKR